MKKALILSAILSFGLSTTALATNIGVINTSVLFKESPLFAKFDKKSKRDFETRKTILLEDKAKIEDLAEDLKTEQKAKKPNQKNIEALRKKINDRQVALVEKEKVFNSQLTTIMDNSRAIVLKHIQQKTQDFAKAKGFDLIIDSASSVYVTQAKDVTTDLADFMKSNTTEEETSKIVETQENLEKQKYNDSLK